MPKSISIAQKQISTMVANLAPFPLFSSRAMQTRKRKNRTSTPIKIYQERGVSEKKIEKTVKNNKNEQETGNNEGKAKQAKVHTTLKIKNMERI